MRPARVRGRRCAHPFRFWRPSAHQAYEFCEIDNVRTVGLADLINMKLASGLRNPSRAIDRPIASA